MIGVQHDWWHTPNKHIYQSEILSCTLLAIFTQEKKDVSQESSFESFDNEFGEENTSLTDLSFVIQIFANSLPKHPFRY